MEDFFQVVIFVLIFIVGPLLEQMRKKKQQGSQQRPRQAPRAPTETRMPSGARVPSESAPVPSEPARVPSSRTEEVTRTDAEPPSAAEMLPDELWEILTGQKRPTPIPVPPTRYEEEAPDEEAEWVEVGAGEIRRPAEVIPTEERSLETYERHKAPVVVSMETLPPPPRVRHEEFHQRIAATSAPAAAPSAMTAAGRLTALVRRGTLRDAMVLQELLGRPKGLE